MKRFLLILSLLLSVWMVVSAQEVASPLIGADHSVTFTISFPNAKNVILQGSFCSKEEAKRCGFKYQKKGYKMEQNGDVWTLRLPSLPSEMYTYRFRVGKKYALDPQNKHITRDIADTLNYFFIRGEIADHYLDKDVPHGRIDTVWYPSELNGMSQRRMLIYTPAEYADSTEKKYPVLYLLHGSGGDETAWTDYGRASQILDDMTSSGSCKPMIVVMPNGNVELDAAPGQSPYMNKQPRSNNMTSMLGKYEARFPEEIVKYTENHYRTIRDKAHRAIAGLSLGGLHTIAITANNPDMFDYIGLFSAQTRDLTSMFGWNAMRTLTHTEKELQRWRIIRDLFNYKIPKKVSLHETVENLDIYANAAEKLDRLFQHPPVLYYIAIGKKDFMMSKPLSKKFSALQDYLNTHNYPYEYHLSDGTHSWENWRKYLVEFLPKLFK